jgi:cell fate regulator YaaT (PSP1 superfamily)
VFLNFELTLDKSKVIFNFTADDRIDFRKLVKVLAQNLRTRI